MEPEKTHNLVTLIKVLSKYTDIPEEINETAVLNDYAVQTRYPGDYTPISEDEYRYAVIMAEECVKWVDKKIKELLKKMENDQRHLYNL